MFTPSPQQAAIVPGTTFSKPRSLAEPSVSKVFYFFTAGMFLLALASIGMAGFAFYKRDSLQHEVEAKKQELDKITYSQEGATLQDMEDLSGRLKGVVSIFTSAPSASSIFSIFESSVERGVFFSRLDVSRTEGTKTYKVTATGRANSLKDLILQRDTLLASPYSKYVSEVAVSSFSRDVETGNVPFVMTMLISVGRFQTSNLLVDLTKPSDNLVPKQQFPPEPVPTPPSNEPKVATTTIVQPAKTVASSTAPSPQNNVAPL